MGMGFDLMRDLRLAWRQLARHPGFSLVVIGTLALGIGANTAIFTVAKGALLDPLPFPESDRLMVVMEANPSKGFPRFSVAPLNWVDFRDQSRSFQSMSARMNASMSLTGEGIQPRRLSAIKITGRYHEVYGVPALQGRWLGPEDDQVDAEKVAVLGFRFWQQQFGGADVLNKTIRLDGEPYRIVGVMPDGYHERRDVFVPLAMDYAETSRGAHYLGVNGRLADGVSIEEARTELITIASRLEAAYPDSNTGWTAVIEPMRELIVEDFRSIVYLLFAAVGLVLIIACVNVANLFLVRLAERERETALRSALGAGRWRLIRQWLAETVSLSLIGGVLGLVLGAIGTRALVQMAADDIPRSQGISVDPGVLLFAFLLSLLTGLVLGLLPALQWTRPALGAMLKEGGRSNSGGLRGRRLRSVLVLAEVALATLMLIGAGLLFRSLDRLVQVDPGFNPHGALTAELSLPESRYEEPEIRSGFYARLQERLTAIPGVAGVGAVMPMPLTDSGFILSFYIEGTEIPEANEFPFSNIRVVNSTYFETMEIPLLKGRAFDGRDVFGTPRVAVINKSTADKYWPEQDPIGRRITFGDPEDEDREQNWLTIVGVVGDVHHESLSTATDPEIYWQAQQTPMEDTTIVLRAVSGDPMVLVEALRAELAAIDPDLPLHNIQTLGQIVDSSLAQPRLNSLLVGLFAALALLLASLGVYGVVSYSVAQNTREIGVRLALGAERPGILALVLGRGLWVVGAGIGLGLLLGLFAGRALSSMMYDISPTDGLTFGVTAGVLLLVGLFACWLPARRATSVDPAVVLRDE